MMSRYFKNILLVTLAVSVLLFASSQALAASALIGGDSKGKGGDYELERVLPGGVHVICRGVTSGSRGGNWIYAIFTATSEEDVILEARGEGSVIFDGQGRQFDFAHQYRCFFIGGVNTSKREIVGGVPTTLEIEFYTNQNNYVLTEKYPKLTVNIMGQKLTFRDVPSF